MPIKLTQRPKISAGATRIVSIDLTEELDADEDLTGSPSVTEISTSDLTISNKSVSSGELTILDRKVDAGKAVQFKVSGQKAGVQYHFRVTVSTDSTPAEIIILDGYFDCI